MKCGTNLVYHDLQQISEAQTEEIINRNKNLMLILRRIKVYINVQKIKYQKEVSVKLCMKILDWPKFWDNRFQG